MKPQKPCRFCEKNVPANCTGEIQDHCTWCGGPVPASELAPGVDRFCSDECDAENTVWDKELAERAEQLED
jgi:hypothetical protein